MSGRLWISKKPPDSNRNFPVFIGILRLRAAGVTGAAWALLSPIDTLLVDIFLISGIYKKER